MIWTWIVSFLISLLPGFDLPSGDISLVSSWVYWINYYVPVDDFLTCFVSLGTILSIAIVLACLLYLL